MYENVSYRTGAELSHGHFGTGSEVYARHFRSETVPVPKCPGHFVATGWVGSRFHASRFSATAAAVGVE